MIGTPHTTKVGHTFPLVTLGFMTCTINPSLTPVPKNMRLFFFPFFEFPREYPRDCPGGPRPCPSLGLGSGPRESAVYPPKTQVYLLRMRPRELKCSHMDETSSSSTNIRALRVRVRVTGALGLGLQGHTIT